MRQTMVVCGLFLTVALAIAWSTEDRYEFRAGDDTPYYVRMHRAEPLDQIPSPYRFRPLVPWVARLLPAKPDGFDTSPESQAIFRFALLNGLGLWVGACVLWRFLRRLEFSPQEGVVGALLFLASYYPVHTGAIPLPDAWSWALLLACLYGIVAHAPAVTAGSFVLGLFTKETILLAPLAAVLHPQTRRQPMTVWLVWGTAAVAYLVFRFALFPEPDPSYSAEYREAFFARLLTGEIAVRLPLDFLRAFGVLWVPALVGLSVVRRHSIAHRWSLVALVVLIAPFLLVKGFGRAWFYAFPFVWPLVLLGIRRLMGADRGHA